LGQAEAIEGQEAFDPISGRDRASRPWRGDFDAANAFGDDGADLEELEADGAAGCRREVGMGEADAAQGGEQHVGHRGEP